MEDNATKNLHFAPYLSNFAPYWGCPGHPLGPFFVAPMAVPTSLEANSCSIPSKLSFVAHTALIEFDVSLNGVEPPFQLLYILQLWVAC